MSGQNENGGQGQQSGNQQGSGQVQGQGEGQNGGQGQQNPGGSLLDEESRQGQQGSGQQQGNEGAGQQQNGGGQNNGGAGQQQGAPLTAEQIADLVARTVESTFDRRINQSQRVQQRLNGGQGGNEGDQQGQGGNGGQEQQQQSGSGQRQQTSGGVDPADLREARSSYREFVGDHIQFLGAEEREHALTLAGHLLTGRLTRGESADEAGRQVARDVATQIKGLRSVYEERTVSALRRKGLLKEPAGGPGQQPPNGGQAPGGASQFQNGASKARDMYASRTPQQSTQQQ